MTDLKKIARQKAFRERQKEKVERLRAAIAPFAALAEFYDSCEQHPDGCPDGFPVGEVVDLTVGDFRRAAQALSPQGKKDGGQ